MKKCLAPFLFALLTGCAATGPENSTTIEFSTSLSSEATFRNLTKPVQDCFTSSKVSSNYFPEAKEGEITVRSGGDIFVITFVNLLVKPVATGSVVIMNYRTFFEPLVTNAPAWARGETVACS